MAQATWRMGACAKVKGQGRPNLSEGGELEERMKQSEKPEFIEPPDPPSVVVPGCISGSRFLSFRKGSYGGMVPYPYTLEGEYAGKRWHVCMNNMAVKDLIRALLEAL